MTNVPIRVLIINKQLGFSVRTKQSLEQLGGFEVSPFTTADAAVEYLQSHPHHIALVDFTMPGPTGTDIIHAIRRVQPNIGIIGSPEIPDVINAARSLNLGGIVDVPCSMRELVPVINRVVGDLQDILPETAEMRPEQDTETVPMTDMDVNTPAAPDFSSLDSVLVRMGGMDYTVGTDTVDVDMSDAGYADDGDTGTIEFVLRGDMTALKEQFDKPQQRPMDSEAAEALDVFQKLAAEEPPMPAMEDSGTIRDLKEEVSKSNLYAVVEAIMEDHTDPNDPADVTDNPTDDAPPPPPSMLPGEKSATPPPVIEEPPIPEGATPAEIVLRSAETSAEDMRPSLEELLDSIVKSESTDDNSGRTRPPWLRDVERFVREPDFLNDALPLLEASVDDATTNTVETLDRYGEDDAPPTPPSNLPEMPGDADTSPLSIKESNRLQADLGSTLQQAAASAIVPVENEDQDDTDDPIIAQMALSLTQLALESTAEAILLARDNEVVSYAGDLPFEDMAHLHETLAGDWDAKPGEARIRFTTLADSGQDYMLYSRKTDGGFTLSMIFEGTSPLHNIRQQSNKIVDALYSTPTELDDEQATAEELATIDELYELEDEVAQEENDAMASTQALLVARNDRSDAELSSAVADVTAPQIVTPEETGPLNPYTYLWMLSDPDLALSREAAQAVVLRLHDWLTSIGWDVHILQVYEDYVYLMIGVPDDETAQEIISEMKEFSARIVAQIDPVPDESQLWADSYCFLTPGREMTQDEIQDFINFERMR